MQKLMNLLPTVLAEIDADGPLALHLAVVQSASSHWNDSSSYLRNREFSSSTVRFEHSSLLAASLLTQTFAFPLLSCPPFALPSSVLAPLQGLSFNVVA